MSHTEDTDKEVDAELSDFESTIDSESPEKAENAKNAVELADKMEQVNVEDGKDDTGKGDAIPVLPKLNLEGKSRNQKKRIKYVRRKKIKAGLAQEDPAKLSTKSKPPIPAVVDTGSKSGAKKRPLTSPGDQPQMVKKAKQSYKNALQSSRLQISIHVKGKPRDHLSDAQISAIRDALADLILEHIRQNPGGDPLRYDRSEGVDGQYLITCADQRSYDWIVSAVSRMNVGVELAATNRSDMPTRVRVGIHFLDCKFSNDVPRLLEIIQGQNPGIHCDRRPVDSDSSSGPSTGDVLFWADDESASYMRTQGFRLRFLTGQVLCWATGTRTAPEGGEPDPTQTELQNGSV